MSETISRTCCKCKVAKPLDDFYRNKSSTLGRAYVCKQCFKVIAKQYARRTEATPATKEARRLAAAKWRKTERGRKYMREYMPRYRAEHRDELRAAAAMRAREYRKTENYRLFEMKNGPARKAVRQAIINGILRPLSQQKCGCGRQAEQYHHHNGYDRPHWLDVIPVCVRCHKRLHMERKALTRKPE